MDNARIHTAMISKACYIKHNKVPIFNVAYCPQFNPIELLFNTLKAQIKRNNIKSESSFRRLLRKLIKEINKCGLENYCNKAHDTLFNN